MPRKQNITPELYNRPLPTRLRQTMHDKRMTADALASIVGVTRQSIGYYQNGDRTPDAVTLGKIAQGLGVSADYLLGNTNTATLNEDAQAAAKLTGLSGKAVDALSKIKASNDGEPFFRALEMLINAYRICDTKKHPLTLLNMYCEISYDTPHIISDLSLSNGARIEYNQGEIIRAILKQEFFKTIDDIYNAEMEEWWNTYAKGRKKD